MNILFMEHGDQHIGFGIMGGMNQPLVHAQFVSNVVDYHMNIQAACDSLVTAYRCAIPMAPG